MSNKELEEKLLSVSGVKLYQAIVALVLYLGHVTRYDMSYTSNQLTRACREPAAVHLTAVKHLPRCLKGHPDLAIPLDALHHAYRSPNPFPVLPEVFRSLPLRFHPSHR